eukprot:TRINITY_DN26144_c0_g1_i1.p1 TRINITY_DN26144_c0_g1~~TRINITY_DN26144_c0_g1_i1.p1  ORF type:complete len:404 (-),score=62.23 TRINITY_DN26144_c0_g1_i1:161-1372(-)
MRASLLVLGPGAPKTRDSSPSRRTSPRQDAKEKDSGWVEVPQRPPSIERLLPRTGRGGGGYGVLNINRVTDGSHWHLVWNDLYHTAIHMPLKRLLFIFVLVYMVSWSFFAVFWMLVSEPCGLELTNFRRAFYLSMESMMTIGYGVPDPYFQDCNEVIPVITAEALFGLLLDAAFLNTLYQRFSAASQRSASMIFSHVAIINEVAETVHWSFRFCELRRTTLLEPSVRVFCVTHKPNPRHHGGVEIEVKHVKLTDPDEDCKVMPSLPVTVHHVVTPGSPLCPPVPEGVLPEDFIPTAAEVWIHLESLYYVELIAIVCGSDGVTGNSVEAAFSYTLSDIKYNHSFVPCAFVDETGYTTVDFVSLHETDDNDAVDSSGDQKESEFPEHENQARGDLERVSWWFPQY